MAGLMPLVVLEFTVLHIQTRRKDHPGDKPVKEYSLLNGSATPIPAVNPSRFLYGECAERTEMQTEM